MNWSGPRQGVTTVTIGQNGFGMVAVRKVWVESMEQLCYPFLNCLKSKYLQCHRNFLCLTIFLILLQCVERKYIYISPPLPSGISSNVGEIVWNVERLMKER
jgi:hypothetical protein